MKPPYRLYNLQDGLLFDYYYNPIEYAVLENH